MASRDRAHRVAPLLLSIVALACAAPSRSRCDPTPDPGVLGSICGFDHAEDLELVPQARVVLASGLRPGAGLWAIAVQDLTLPEPGPWRIWPGTPTEPGEASGKGTPGCSEPPDPGNFVAHGLAARPDPQTGAVAVAVVNHGGREAIELFDLFGEGRSVVLSWRGCIPLPPGLMGNDVAIAPDGEVVVTNFVPRYEGIALKYVLLKAALGFETGDVIAWSRERGWRVVPGTRGAGPNGLVLSPDGRFIYFAENGRHRVVRVPRDGASPEQPPHFAALGSNVDNISWADEGRLLAIIHTGGIESAFEPCLMSWALWEVDTNTLKARELMHHRGETLCGATSAAKVGDRYLIGSMSETRIGVWRESQ